MRRISVSIVAFMALFGLLALGSGEARAQGMAFDNVMEWWDHLSCERMIGVVRIPLTGGTAASAIDANARYTHDGTMNTNGERRWCTGWDGLNSQDQRLLTRAATGLTGNVDITRMATDDLINTRRWWDALNFESQDFAVGGLRVSRAQLAAGEDTAATPIPDATATTAGLLTAVVPFATGLFSGETPRVDAAAMALSGDSPMTPTTTPAVPLVGLGLLGLLLAGRGAYLRRRRA